MRRLKVERWPLRRRLALIALQLIICAVLAWWITWEFLLLAGLVVVVNVVNIRQNRNPAA